jgi:hypothetical protein
MAESGVCSRLETEDEAMPGDPQECRQQAQECLHLAQQAASDPARQDYTALAHTWMELARVFESDNALAECLSAAGSNVVPRQTIRLKAS